MLELSNELDQIIYQEMLAHPVLFHHTSPQKIAIIGDTKGIIANEIVKHDTVKEIWHTAAANTNDMRLQLHTLETLLAKKDFFDIIIVETLYPTMGLNQYFTLLKEDGILVQLSDSPFYINGLKTLQQELKTAGFRDQHILSFPQPTFPTGWRAALLAKKAGVFKKIREKDIFNKTFSTRYYNFDVHKAALAVPEFVREELMI